MDLQAFLNVMAIANAPKSCADSLILVYLDNCDVRGPFFGESAQCGAYDNAIATGRPFKFSTWAHKG
jgi:hypothetical protein